MNFENILNEATEIKNEYDLAKMILRGQISGVSAKTFFGKHYDFIQSKIEKQEKSMPLSFLSYLLKIIKSSEIPSRYENALIFLILKKAKEYNNINIQFSIDPYLTYFQNKNKKEAKENPEIKSLFDKFEKEEINSKFNNDFEQKINAFFAQKATVKSNNEIEVIYPKDEEGWEVFSPKTFAAAKQLACIANRKAKWCTAAGANYFNRYTENNNKLYIIRNNKKDLIYQMDWGEIRDNSKPNFMDENDNQVSFLFALKNIPLNVLRYIKNKNGENVADLINLVLNKEKKEDKKLKENWEAKKIDFVELEKLIEDYNINMNSYFFKDYKVSDALSKNNEQDKYFLLTNKEKKLLFIYSNQVIYSKNNKIISLPLFELNKNGTSKIYDKEKIVDANLPKKVKEYFFKEKELKKIDYIDYSFDDYKIYLLKNLAAFRKLATPGFYANFKAKLKEIDFNKKDINKNIFNFYTRPFNYLYIRNKKINYLINIKEFYRGKVKAFSNDSYGVRSVDANKLKTFLNSSKTLKDFFKKNFYEFYKNYEFDFNNFSFENEYKRKLEEYKKNYFPIFKIINGINYYYIDSLLNAFNFYRIYKNKYNFKKIETEEDMVFSKFIYIDKNNNVINLNKFDDNLKKLIASLKNKKYEELSNFEKKIVNFNFNDNLEDEIIFNKKDKNLFRYKEYKEEDKNYLKKLKEKINSKIK